MQLNKILKYGFMFETVDDIFWYILMTRKLPMIETCRSLQGACIALLSFSSSTLKKSLRLRSQIDATYLPHYIYCEHIKVHMDIRCT
jgi:hypothetical protein